MAPDKSQDAPPSGPPYPPTGAALGGSPTIPLDVPVSAVFLFLFMVSAIGHMTVFQINRRRQHKFIMSGMLFGFSMTRCVAMVMRIVWANYPTNVSIAIAASVFTQAGTVLLFVINLIFTQRILRAAHPNSGWHPFFGRFFVGCYALIVISLVMSIIVSVHMFFTLDPDVHRMEHDVQLFGQTVFALLSFLPLPLVVIGLVIPRRARVENFGSGRFRSKIAILLFTSTILCLGACFRAGANYLPARPTNDPAWYQSKACFYVFYFVIEVIIVFLYLALRVDKRFHVPNGAKKAGDYAAGLEINTEEDVFDGRTTDSEKEKELRKGKGEV